MDSLILCAVAVIAFASGAICSAAYFRSRYDEKPESRTTEAEPPQEDARAESLRKQWENLMSYTGRDQFD